MQHMKSRSSRVHVQNRKRSYHEQHGSSILHDLQHDDDICNHSQSSTLLNSEASRAESLPALLQLNAFCSFFVQIFSSNHGFEMSFFPCQYSRIANVLPCTKAYTSSPTSKRFLSCFVDLRHRPDASIHYLSLRSLGSTYWVLILLTLQSRYRLPCYLRGTSSITILTPRRDVIASRLFNSKSISFQSRITSSHKKVSQKAMIL